MLLHVILLYVALCDTLIGVCASVPYPPWTSISGDEMIPNVIMSSTQPLFHLLVSIRSFVDPEQARKKYFSLCHALHAT